ncbi:MAG: TolC family protein [Carboxylicivirga sp.]|nr:TolC family protein [Carboxylicivirga sp.]
MKALSIISIIFICLQTNVASDKVKAPISKLPSLEYVIQQAIANSALVKEQISQNEMVEKDLQIEKRNWMNYLYLEGAANYGMYDNLFIQSSTGDSQVTTGALNRNEQTAYYAGVGLKLPISALTNRGRELKKRKLAIQKAQHQLEDTEKQIRHIIIELYYSLKFLEESMYAYLEIYQTLEISYQKAQKDLLNGRTDLDDFALLASTTGKAKNDYLKAKHTFMSEYKKLESITGLNFNQLSE